MEASKKQPCFEALLFHDAAVLTRPLGFEKGAGMTQSKEGLIYVVDDEPLLLDLAEEALSGMGYRVLRFSDPTAAWQSFASASHPPLLLITDYMMPGMTGVELLLRCKGVCPQLKTIVLSGTVREEALGQLPVRVDRFLQKPCPISVFETAVRTVLAESS